MLNYNKLEKEREKAMLECCSPSLKNPIDPGTGDCCYDFWTTDSVIVDRELKKWTARSNHKQKELTNLTTSYNTISLWCHDWQNVDKLINSVCSSIDLFIRHITKVSGITESTVDASEILFCMIRDLYIRVDKLNEEYDKLMKCIACLKNPALASGGIIACLSDYGTKLTAVIATRDALIGQVVTAMGLAIELNQNIADKDHGLKSLLIYWDKNLRKDDSEDAAQKKLTKKVEEPVIDEYDLRPLVGPTVLEGIDKYYKELNHQRENELRRMDRVKEELQEANEKVAAITARKNGITGALTAVNAAGICS